MKLQDCLYRLANGELANTSFTDGDQIKDDKLEFIISLVNEALTRLYTRFVLKEDVVFVEENEVTTRYVLSSAHIQDKCDLLNKQTCIQDYSKYIFSTPDQPFTDNVIKVIGINGADGFEYSLNESNDPFSIFTPAYNIIQVNYPDPNEVLAVRYQAKHPVVSEETMDQELELPDAFQGALIAYIAYLAYSSTQSENQMAAAQKYFSVYTALLDELVTFDIGSSQNRSNDKFIKNGWC